jgi:hypothetical protein
MCRSPPLPSSWTTYVQKVCMYVCVCLCVCVTDNTCAGGLRQIFLHLCDKTGVCTKRGVTAMTTCVCVCISVCV